MTGQGQTTGTATTRLRKKENMEEWGSGANKRPHARSKALVKDL